MAKFEFTQTSGDYIQPAWAAEPIGPQNLIPGGAQLDPMLFPYSDGFIVTVTAAETASATATIAVAALAGDIPGGYILNFGGNKYAALSSKATKGDTNLNANLSANLVGNETATYAGVSGKKLVKAGTLVGRTWAERDTGTPFGPAVETDEEVYLLAFDTPDAAVNSGCELLRHQTMVRDHLLPQWSSLSAGLKALVRSKYQCLRGPMSV